MQYGNDILFSDILGKRAEADLSNTIMIDIVDANVCSHVVFSFSPLLKTFLALKYEVFFSDVRLEVAFQNSDDCIQTSQGFVIMYSITDRESFYEAADIFTLIEQTRGGKVGK